MSELNCNFNAVASRLIASTFNSFASSGIALTYDSSDSEGITLRKFVKSEATPKPDMVLLQRRTGDCVGTYMHVRFAKEFNIKSRDKCFVRATGGIRAPRIQLVLSSAAPRMPSREVALVSFDPEQR